MKLTVNRNTVPFDERPPTVASGVRIGTPAATMRGFDEDDFREVGRIIVERARSRTRDLDGAARARRGALREAAALSRVPRLHDVRRVTAAQADRRLTHVTHPLVQHKLSYLRDRDTPTVHFRKLVDEVTLLLTYEATKDFPIEEVEIETPLERTTVPRISGKKVAVCPVLRAGVGMLDGVLSLISSARVGFIGLYRDEETLEPVEYYVKLPVRPRRARRDRPRPDARDRQLERRRDQGKVKDAGARSVILVCIVAAPEGIERVHAEYPDVHIVCAAIDRGLERDTATSSPVSATPATACTARNDRPRAPAPTSRSSTASASRWSSSCC